MKKLYFKKLIFLLFLPFVLFTSVSQAKNYYISAAGTNTNSGLTPATSWQTIAKLNSSFNSIVAGDSILFKSGETFYGAIVIGKSGTTAKPIVISSYGTGAKPIITGLSTITGWVNLGGNIWEASTTKVKTANNLVLRNGIIQQVGRYPNANAANGGYLKYTAATAKSVTGPALSSVTNWTGAEIAVRLFRWEIRRRKITAHSGGVVTFETMTNIPKVNYGYFFQRDSRTLDQDGEWFQNGTTNKLRMYFANNNPASYSVQAATIDTLLYNFQKSNITLYNLSFIGSNKFAIMNNGTSGIIVRNCDASNNGQDAFTAWYCTNVTVDGCTTNNSLGSGIRVTGPTTGTVNLTVKNSTVNNTALKAGMETTDIPSGGMGINCRGGDNVQILNNVVKNSGYNGIAWRGNNVNIKYNLVDSFCSVRDDGGGIYTYETAGNKIVNGINRNIVSNIILNGISASHGTDGFSESSVVGVYTDEGVRDVIIDSNTVSSVYGNGFHGNGNGNITIRNNTTYNTIVSTSFQRLADENPVRGIVIKKNIFYPYRFRHRNLAINLPTLITRHADILAMGKIDSNYYSLRAGKDTSSASITRYADGSNSIALNTDFSYLTGTAGIETHSIKVANTGTLEYNASKTPKIISFQGLSKKDVFGNIYTNSVTIPAWGSKVLIPNGGVVAPNKAPVANAGTTKVITLPSNNISFTGSGTDTDGTISSYAWIKISGPSSGTIATANAAATAVNNLVQGVYQYQLTVTDNNGLTGKDTVQVTVNAALNKAPKGNAGTDKSITLPINTATLSGTGTDTDGTISIYAWIKISGPVTGTIATANAATTSLNNLTQGVYQYQLTVTDNNGLTGKDTVQVTVNAAVNKAPKGNAGTDKSITLPINTATLSGTGTDTDGTISSFAWIKIAGPSSGTIATANAAATAVNNLVQGVYQYQLTVTDNNGLTGKDTVQVTVNAALNKAPKGNAGTDKSITLPINTAILSGTGTDTDGTISIYVWIKISGPVTGTIATANAATTALNNLTQGVYQYQLTVTDNNGLTGKDTVQVTVNAAVNKAPNGNAGTDKSITLPINTATLSGTGTDTDGSISSYAWIKISGPVTGTIATANAATATLSNLSQGIYQYQLTVTDNNGLIGKDTVQVTVNAAVNKAPKGNAGTDKSITLPINATTLSGTGTDTDGTIGSYAWIKISGPVTGTIATAKAATTALNNLMQGVYQFQLTVTDNYGATGIDTVQVTVNVALNQIPAAHAGTDTTLTLPTNTIRLTGSASDTDGTISSYTWTKISGPFPGTIATTDAASTALFDLVHGVYQYELIVTDNNGAIGKDTVQVTVNAAPNQSPVAIAGSDNVITLPINTSTLTGGATDADGTVISLEWIKISGPLSGTIATPNDTTTEINNLEEGVYQFELSVTDNNGAIGKDTVLLTVNAASNQSPVAIAGSDNVITLPINTSTLTGGATDADGTVISLEWLKISGPLSGTIATPNDTTTEIYNLEVGVYQFELTVTDNNGAIGKDTVQLTVNAAPNQSPVAIAGSDNVITLPINASILTGGATDTDGTVISFEWIKISGPSAGTIATPYDSTTEINNLEEGVYQFELTLVDNNGAMGKDTVQVTVNAAVSQAREANAGTDNVITLPTNTSFLNGAANAEGMEITYEWIQILGPSSGTITSPNASATEVNNLAEGVYQYELTVTNNNRILGRDTVQVTVNAAASQALTANAGNDIEVRVPTNRTDLTGTGTVTGGWISNYAWTKLSGPLSGKIAVADSATTLIIKLVEGVYEFELTVTDNNGTMAKDTVQVMVIKAGRQAPVAQAGRNLTIRLPLNTATLSGKGNDADGAISNSVWAKIDGPSAGAITTTNNLTTLVNNLVKGIYRYELTVTDNSGAIGKDTVQITVDEAAVISQLFTGTGENNEMKIYPNPVRDVANLAISTNGKTKLSVSIADLTGRLVKSNRLVNLDKSDIVRLDMSGLRDGYYIITVRFDDGRKISSKVIKYGGN